MNTSINLYLALIDFFIKYLYASDEEIALLALFAAATHFYQGHNTFPILHITGDFETGKNRRLDLLKLVCYMAEIYISTTPPNIYRSIEKKGGTYMIDEADEMINSRQGSEILLAGYKKGSSVPRQSRDDNDKGGYRSNNFSVYSPKVLVTRNGIKDDALYSRCITIVTTPKPNDSNIPDVLPNVAYNEGKLLNETLSQLMKHNEEFQPALKLRGRNFELFSPLDEAAQIFGDDAVDDLQEFIDIVYLPQRRNTTIMTPQEDLVNILNDLWNHGHKAHLTVIKELLLERSSDYKFTNEKDIATRLRSLNFEVKERDNQGYYVTYNPGMIKLWKDRYLPDMTTNEIDESIKGPEKSSNSDIDDISKSGTPRANRESLLDKMQSLLDFMN